MILGHAALAVLAKKTAFRTAPALLLLVATYGPDLIDKTGMLVMGVSGKGVGHCLVTFVALALATALSPARRLQPNRVWTGVALLWLSHLILDLTEPAVLFWPLLGPFPANAPYGLSEGFVSFYTGRGDHLVLVFDLLCLAAALAVMLPRPRRGAPKA